MAIGVVWMFFVLNQTHLFLLIWLFTLSFLTVGLRIFELLKYQFSLRLSFFHLCSLKLLHLLLLLFVNAKPAFLMLAIVVLTVRVVWTTMDITYSTPSSSGYTKNLRSTLEDFKLALEGCSFTALKLIRSQVIQGQLE